MKFPVSTSQLTDWLPHRGTAVWVDEVISITDNGGEGLVRLNNSANYSDGRGNIRDSSFIEWMAQSYGFICACQGLAGLVSAKEKPTKAFLVQVTDFDLSDDPSSSQIIEGDWMTVRIQRTHQVGPIALVEGQVLSSKNIVIARAKLKLFAA